MKIAYLTSYLDHSFMAKFGQNKRFALSGPLKSLGLARAMMSAGHEVTIFSAGVTTLGASIPAFDEFEEYPEGRLKIKYCNILSKHRCGPINDWRISRLLPLFIALFAITGFYWGDFSNYQQIVTSEDIFGLETFYQGLGEAVGYN